MDCSECWKLHLVALEVRFKLGMDLRKQICGVVAGSGGGTRAQSQER